MSTSNQLAIIPREQPTIGARIRRWFLAGVLVVVPIIAVFWAIRIILSLADAYFGPIVKYVIEAVIDPKGPLAWTIAPLVLITSLLIALAFIAAVGWLSTFIAVRNLIKFGESVLHKIPVIKFFYTTPKEVISTLTSARGNSYNRVVLVEYPMNDQWTLGFATGQVNNLAEVPLRVCVFMPHTPNPTTGVLVYLQPSKILDTDLTFEAAIRLIMSGGILAQPNLKARPFDISRPLDSHAPIITDDLSTPTSFATISTP